MTDTMKAKAKKKESIAVEMHWDSSMIDSTRYLIEDETLEITFVSGGSYRYSGVTNKEYLEFAAADSQGKHFIANIRNNHDYEKINDN